MAADVAGQRQPEAPHLVFVFGTLKEGFPNFATNQGVRMPGTFRTLQRYPLYLVGERHSPWLVHAEGQGLNVVGQVFQVSDAVLEAMDKLERVSQPDGYRRLPVEVQHDSSDRIVPVHAYMKPAEQLLPSEIRLGPLEDYTLELAALYRPRG